MGYLSISVPCLRKSLLQSKLPASSSDIQHHTLATIKVVDKGGTVVFAYAFDQDYSIHRKQKAAEACAKNLKKEIE